MATLYAPVGQRTGLHDYLVSTSLLRYVICSCVVVDVLCKPECYTGEDRCAVSVTFFFVFYSLVSCKKAKVSHVDFLA